MPNTENPYQESVVQIQSPLSPYECYVEAQALLKRVDDLWPTENLDVNYVEIDRLIKLAEVYTRLSSAQVPGMVTVEEEESLLP